jgi:hypothetical protein
MWRPISNSAVAEIYRAVYSPTTGKRNRWTSLQNQSIPSLPRINDDLATITRSMQEMIGNAGINTGLTLD